MPLESVGQAELDVVVEDGGVVIDSSQMMVTEDGDIRISLNSDGSKQLSDTFEKSHFRSWQDPGANWKAYDASYSQEFTATVFVNVTSTHHDYEASIDVTVETESDSDSVSWWTNNEPSTTLEATGSDWVRVTCEQGGDYSDVTISGSVGYEVNVDSTVQSEGISFNPR